MTVKTNKHPDVKTMDGVYTGDTAIKKVKKGSKKWLTD